MTSICEDLDSSVMQSDGLEAFSERLWREAEAKASWVCLGLDVDLERLPDPFPRSVGGARRFLLEIVDACADTVVAFKPNLAFYIALGVDGIRLLRDLRDAVGHRAIFILDAKVGDVSDTSKRYATTLFDVFDADAVTFNAWGGHDSIGPLIDRPERGAFAWVRSSNPDADDIQGLNDGGMDPIYLKLASIVANWNTLGNLGIVVGATRPSDMACVRERAPTMPILAPGVGAQGGMLEATVEAGFGSAPGGVVVNAGRTALWSGDGPDFARETCAVLEEMRVVIETVRSGPVRSDGR